MSTYYYMACNDHKIVLDAIIAVERLSGAHLDSQKELLDFLMQHRDCQSLKFLSEHSFGEGGEFDKFKWLKPTDAKGRTK